MLCYALFISLSSACRCIISFRRFRTFFLFYCSYLMCMLAIGCRHSLCPIEYLKFSNSLSTDGHTKQKKKAFRSQYFTLYVKLYAYIVYGCIYGWSIDCALQWCCSFNRKTQDWLFLHITRYCNIILCSVYVVWCVLQCNTKLCILRLFIVLHVFTEWCG